jgi:hypothetical protein
VASVENTIKCQNIDAAQRRKQEKVKVKFYNDVRQDANVQHYERNKLVSGKTQVFVRLCVCHIVDPTLSDPAIKLKNMQQKWV